MNNGFLKFKKRVRLSAILRSVLVGVSLGVIVTAVLLIVAGLTNGEPDLVTYCLIGGGVALASGAVSLAILMPSDKRLAKRLDNKLELNEKVQTMVAFSGEDSDMLQLQREDADDILQQIPVKRIRSKLAWLIVILPVLACGSLVGSIFVNAQEPPEEKPPVDNSWYLNPYDDVALENLIEYVRSSNMDSEPKDQVVGLLERLRSQLKVIRKESQMKETVVKCIDEIHVAVSSHHSYKLVATALARSSEEMLALSGALNSLSSDKLDAAFTTMLETMVPKVEEDAPAAQETDLLPHEMAAKLAADMRSALNTSGEDPENSLYKALEDFASDLETVTASMTPEEITKLVNDNKISVTSSIQQPKTDVEVEMYVINQLMKIFGITADQINDDIMSDLGEENVGKAPDSDDEPKKDTEMGGIGDGVLVVGSDDSMYDPKQDLIVLYASVLKEYSIAVDEMIHSADTPAELADLLRAYFAALADTEN